jgi:hypothetical protein
MIHASPEVITVEAVSGGRYTVKLEDLKTPELVLSWCLVWQLIELNQLHRKAIGSFDPVKREGMGFAGAMGQQTLSLLECSERLGMLQQMAQDGQEKAEAAMADALNPEAVLEKAMGAVTKGMAALMGSMPGGLPGGLPGLAPPGGGNGGDKGSGS